MRFILFLLLFNLSSLAQESSGEAVFKKLLIQPQRILLDHREDTQSLVAQAFYSDDMSRDIIDQVKIEILDPSICSYEAGQFKALKNGVSQVIASYKASSVKLSVTCQNVEKEQELNFGLHVMPVFTKAACNTGGCHGASRGQDRFQLSLFGFDPDGDYFRILNEFPGRRVNLAVPEDSMLLTKALKQVPHTGGKLFDKDSKEYEVLLKWLKMGAPKDKKDIKKATRLEFFPANSVIAKGTSQRLSIRVLYSDGSDADVTHLCSFISSDDSLAKVNSSHALEAHKTGEAFVMARFGTLTALTQLISLDPESKRIDELQTYNYIDDAMNKKWRELRLPPSETSNDEVFLRRVYIDLIGQLPTEKQYREFMTDQSSDKRSRLIDELLEKPEFIDIWIMKWAEILQIRSFREFSYKNTLLYFDWLKQKMKQGVKLDKLVHELLTSSGHTFENPGANFYQIEKDVLKRSENIAQAFMGRQIQCAQCHNHPFDQWSMNDYYGFAAFFAQVGSKVPEDPRASIIFDKRNGGVKHPVTKKALEPVFLGGDKPDLKGRDRREVFADWLVAKENPYFAKNISNRIWDHFFGQGIINPVDDARLSNPPSNQILLDNLSEKLIEYNFDTKELIRDLCNSRTYQLSSQSLPENKSDTRNFSYAKVRRMRAEVLLDTISQITHTKDKFKALPVGARAVEVADGNSGSYFLKTFGRASRETVCACDVSVEPNLSQALHLLNGDTINRKIAEAKFLKVWLKEKMPIKKIIEKLYIRTYTRKPSETESSRLIAQVVESKNTQETLEDIFWALLNSKEFIFVR